MTGEQDNDDYQSGRLVIEREVSYHVLGLQIGCCVLDRINRMYGGKTVEIEPMNGNIIIKNASELVTCSGFQAKKGPEMADLHVINEGSVVVEDGKISFVGKTCDLPEHPDPERFDVLDASGKAVLPGFVDSHTHFVFGGYRADEFSWRLSGMNYMNIMSRGGGIASSVSATRDASFEELMGSGRKRLDSMLSFGITTVEGKSGYGLGRDTELRQLEVMAELDRTHPMDIVRTFLGAHAVPSEYNGRTEEFLDFVREAVLPEVAEKGLAEFCDIFCEKGVFSVEQSRRLLLRARALGLNPTLHADEIVHLGGAELKWTPCQDHFLLFLSYNHP